MFLLVFLTIVTSSSSRVESAGSELKIVLVLLAHAIRIHVSRVPLNSNPSVGADVLDNRALARRRTVLVSPLPIATTNDSNAHLHLGNQFRSGQRQRRQRQPIAAVAVATSREFDDTAVVSLIRLAAVVDFRRRPRQFDDRLQESDETGIDDERNADRSEFGRQRSDEQGDVTRRRQRRDRFRFASSQLVVRETNERRQTIDEPLADALESVFENELFASRY